MNSVAGTFAPTHISVCSSTQIASHERLRRRFTRVLVWSLAVVPALAATSPRFFASDFAATLGAPAAPRSSLIGVITQASSKVPLLATIALGLAAILIRSQPRTARLVVGSTALTLGVVCSMVFSEHPGFRPYYLGRHYSVPVAVRIARVELAWMAYQIFSSLRLYLYGSLLAILIAPKWSLDLHYHDGFLPWRLYGLTPHANVLGAILATMFLVGFLVAQRPYLVRVEMVLALVMLVFTQSKTSLLGLAAGILVMAIVRGTSEGVARRAMAGYALLVAGIAVVAFGAWTEVRLLVTALVNPNANLHALTGRGAVWAATLDVWRPNRLWDTGSACGTRTCVSVKSSG